MLGVPLLDLAKLPRLECSVEPLDFLESSSRVLRWCVDQGRMVSQPLYLHGIKHMISHLVTHACHWLQATPVCTGLWLAPASLGNLYCSNG